MARELRKFDIRDTAKMPSVAVKTIMSFDTEAGRDTDRVDSRRAGIRAVQHQHVGPNLGPDLGADLFSRFGDEERGARRCEQAPEASARNDMPGKKLAIKKRVLERHQGVEIAPASAAKLDGGRAAVSRHAICPCKLPCSMRASNVSNRSRRSA